MNEAHFLLLIPASAGIFFAIYFTLMLVIRLTLSYMEKRAPVKAYNKAYEKGSTSDVARADRKLAYQKLTELATTKKGYRSRKADLNFVIEMDLPPSARLLSLLTKALPNQNNQEMIELMTGYLQEVTQALKNGAASNTNKTIPDRQIFNNNHVRYYVPATTFFILVAIILLYLFPWVESLTKNQWIGVGAFIVLSLTTAFSLLRRKFQMLPMYFAISTLIFYAILYSYSNIYHINNLIPHSDPKFNGIVDCPRWLRADDSCSTPIAITSNSNEATKMRIIYDKNTLYLIEDDGTCNEKIGTDFSVTQTLPFSFQLKSKNSDLFTENGNHITIDFAILSDSDVPTTLEGLTCDIQLESEIWADSRDILFNVLGISGGIAFLPFIIYLGINLKKTF